MEKHEPLFVVIEGIDRVGKDVQAERLTTWLSSRGGARKLATPNYGSPSGQLISQCLRGKTFLAEAEDFPASLADVGRSPQDALALECALIADRYVVAHHVREALADGVHAVCVRWWQSAHVYGRRDGIDSNWIRCACSSLPVPDVSILLDAAPVTGRLEPGSRYEKVDVQEDLRRRYLSLWGLERSLDDKLWVVIRADSDVDAVAARVRDVMLVRFPWLGADS